MMTTLLAWEAGWRMEHYNIVQKSSPALKAAVLIACLILLAWLFKGIKKGKG